MAFNLFLSHWERNISTQCHVVSEIAVLLFLSWKNNHVSLGKNLIYVSVLWFMELYLQQMHPGYMALGRQYACFHKTDWHQLRWPWINHSRSKRNKDICSSPYSCFIVQAKLYMDSMNLYTTYTFALAMMRDIIRIYTARFANSWTVQSWICQYGFIFVCCRRIVFHALPLDSYALVLLRPLTSS